MKSPLKVIFISFISFFLVLETYAITNFEINKICRKERKVKECIKRIKTNRQNLNNGIPIEIPVVPYKNK